MFRQYNLLNIRVQLLYLVFTCCIKGYLFTINYKRTKIYWHKIKLLLDSKINKHCMASVSYSQLSCSKKYHCFYHRQFQSYSRQCFNVLWLFITVVALATTKCDGHRLQIASLKPLHRKYISSPFNRGNLEMRCAVKYMVL